MIMKRTLLINLNRSNEKVQFANFVRTYAKMLSDAEPIATGRKKTCILTKKEIPLSRQTIHQLKKAPRQPVAEVSKPFISKVHVNKSKNNEKNFDDLVSWNKIDFSDILFNQSVKQGIPIPKITIDNVGSASLLGRRTKNEDRIRIKELMPNLLYFAVFDGHGGSLCAQFCQNHMEDFIHYRLRSGEKDLREVLEKSFIDINNVFAHFLTFNKRVPKEEENSGTTATVCLLRNSVELVVGHVGDSRAILCRNGKAQRLTIDHTGDLKSEKERITRSGGRIERDNLGRCLVNERLAMTRSIGDYDLKPFGVTAVPDTKEVEIKHGTDSFLILTTDGINYVMNDEEILTVVNSCRTPQEAAQYVNEQAMLFSSEDNASNLIIQFGSWLKFSSNNIKFTFGRQLNKTLSSRS